MGVKRTSDLFTIMPLLLVSVLSSPKQGAFWQQERCPQEEHALSLVVVSVFKNEADVLKEWIEHHLWQGVEHFYLVDNGSTDDYMWAIGNLATRVTVIVNATKHAQRDHLNSLLQLTTRARWLMSIDVDEFVYARPISGHKTIASYLSALEAADCLQNYISLPWRMFGSSGFVRQTQSVRMAFTRAANTTWLDRIGHKCLANISCAAQR